MQMQGTGEEVMDLDIWGTDGGQRGPGATSENERVRDDGGTG